jgi:hypothetical protein
MRVSSEREGRKEHGLFCFTFSNWGVRKCPRVEKKNFHGSPPPLNYVLMRVELWIAEEDPLSKLIHGVA